jgi:hypothetical protein
MNIKCDKNGQKGGVASSALSATMFYKFFSVYCGIVSQSYNKNASKCGPKKGVDNNTLSYNTFIMLIFYSGQFEIYNINFLFFLFLFETGVLPATPLFQPYFLHCSYDLVYMLMQSHL